MNPICEEPNVKQAQKGFTLVELMIVVAIIGILAAVAIPKFAQMLEKSREGATKGNLSALKSAASNYYADQQGIYPKTLDTGTQIIGTTTYPAFLPNYISEVSPVKVTGANTVNGAANVNLGPGVSSGGVVTTGVWSSPGFASTSVGQGWKYDNTIGAVWVNSAMVDMTGNPYTEFGFQ
jgi:prepilin-type N-terminal cleavage/methylation domain-containing protein